MATHRWDRVYELGVRGDGVTIAIVEDGAVSNSGTGINLSGWALPAPGITTHATAVAGVAASDHSVLPGHARGASVFSAGFVNATWAEIMGAATSAISGGAEVLNMSWGGDSQRQLTVMDRYWDYQVRYNTVTVTVAAGNYGTGSGNVMYPAIAWNCITVGAAEDLGNADWSDDIMAGYSSFNDPISTHGDREKPELCAIGSGLSSMGIGGTPTSVRGTSFSTPTMAGIAACLIQADPGLGAWPEGMKAVLMAAATHNIEGASRLSEKDGAGCINGLQALRIVEQRQVELGTFYPNLLTTAHTATLAPRGRSRRAVLCWCSDADRSYANGTLKADLDLGVLQVAAGLIATSSSFDNSYEIVEFCPSATGWYTIWVNAHPFDERRALRPRLDPGHRRPLRDFRPTLPDVLDYDLVGPVIGNPNFALDPYDPINPGPLHLYRVGRRRLPIYLAGCRSADRPRPGLDLGDPWKRLGSTTSWGP